VLGIAFALSSSLSWGVSDFIGGMQARRLPLLRLMLISQGIGLITVAVVVALRGQGPPDTGRLLAAAAGGLGGVAGLTAFYRALAIGTMSIVAPIAATGVCVPVVVGIAGGEHPAAIRLAGIAAAIAGVVLASREQPQGAQATPRHSRASVLLALVAALGFGAMAVGLRSGARGDVLWALLASRVAGVGSIALLFAVLRPPKGQARMRPVPLLAMGVLDVSANGLYALATRHGLLSIVSVAASLYPLVTVLLARTLLGERVHRVQELGVLAALAGVVLIAAG
jgi:drug/metabolite transporter (DMT)-like permease